MSGAPRCRVSVKVIPNASRNEIVGWLGDSLKIKLQAPPVDGKANEALCRFLAETFNLSPRSVVLLQGAGSRLKMVELDGLDLTSLRDRVKSIA